MKMTRFSLLTKIGKGVRYLFQGNINKYVTGYVPLFETQ
jgi:hypothetical protein